MSKNNATYSLSSLGGGIFSLVSAGLFKKKFFIHVDGDHAWQIATEKNKTILSVDDFQKAKKSGRVGFLFWLQKFLCKRSEQIIVPSECVKRLVSGWNVPSEKIKIIYDPIDFKPAELSKEEARKKIGIHGNLLISVGKLAPWKGFKMLIKIMPKLLEINQFFRLVIIGDGPDRKNLELIIRNLGLDRKVYLVGQKSKDELAVYLAASDIFILNSGYEGFPRELLEAMAAGIPIVASAVMGNREIVHQGENGFLVKYNDEFNLIEAVKTLRQDPELKEQFVAGGKQTALKYSFKL